MRAWHDTVHMALGLGMSTENELTVAHYQLNMLPSGEWGMGRFVSIDTAGQTMYKEERGDFPGDQPAFTRFVWDRIGLSGDNLYEAILQYKE